MKRCEYVVAGAHVTSDSVGSSVGLNTATSFGKSTVVSVARYR